jgi:hypothetical protein
MLLWADGFGTYGNTARMRSSGGYVYTTNSGAEPLQIGSGAGSRTGNYYWSTYQTGYQNWYGGHMVGGASAILGCGLALYMSSYPGVSNWFPIMFCGDTKDVFQASIRVNTDGSISAHSGKGGVEYGRSIAGVVVPGAYSYIEARVFVDAVNGTLEIRRNNAVVYLGTGLNTRPLGYSRACGIMTGSGSGSSMGGTVPFERVSDYVIWDAAGAYNNDFLGDVRCRTFFPAADGPEQDWAPTGAATNWEAVDAVPYNDAIYSASDAVAEKVNFSKAALPINTAYIAGVQLFAAVNKSDAGTCEVTPQLYGDDGTVANGSPISPGTGTAQYFSQFDVNPTTGAPFTRAEFDAALFGLERTA